MATRSETAADGVQRGVQPHRDVAMLEAYLQELGYLDQSVGHPDQDIVAAVRRFQSDNGLVVDGIAGEKTWTRLFAVKPDLARAIADKWLSQADIDAVAAEIELPVPTVRAVYKVESNGSGFWALHPKILFEGHIFWQRLLARGRNPAALQAGNEDVLYPAWDRTKYLGGPAEYRRLAKAQAIDSSAALESASWGLFQILGSHAVRLGYGSVESFEAAMYQGEREQLDAFGRFVQDTSSRGRSLLYWLQQRNWQNFALGYNGPRYGENQYDRKLQAAFDEARSEQ